MKSDSEVFEEYLQHVRFSTEGETGVKKLAQLTRALGYRDSTYFGQFRDGCYGDLFIFLEDNPGAIEVIVDWIRDNLSDDQRENLESELPIEEPEEEEIENDSRLD